MLPLTRGACLTQRAVQVFRTNSSYARWEEGRRLWGQVLNRTRDICRLVSGHAGQTWASPGCTAHLAARRQDYFATAHLG